MISFSNTVVVFSLFPYGSTDLDSNNCYDNNVYLPTFWMLLLSGAFFFFPSLLLCCVPRPDPCLQNRSGDRSGDQHEASKHEHEAEEIEAPEITPSHSGGDGPHYVETY
jgi:hypothetical protein